MNAAAELEREALRLFRRYTVEIVEALGFCPWAEGAREKGEVRENVELARVPDPEVAAAWVRQLGEDPRVQIGFLLHPCARLTRAAFEAHVRAVREAYARNPGPAGALMAIVGFHPNAEANLRSPLALVNFVRRSPDPTIQAVRLSTLEAVRKGEGRGTLFLPPGSDLSKLPKHATGPALHERVAEANLQTVQRLGVATIEAKLADIMADRERSYRALGLEV